MIVNKIATAILIFLTGVPGFIGFVGLLSSHDNLSIAHVVLFTSWYYPFTFGIATMVNAIKQLTGE